MKIYLFDDIESITPAICDKLVSSLPDDRREKALRYKRFDDRALCAVSYKLLEYGLKKDFGVESFTLAYKEKGKPYLADAEGAFFNIRHCANGCICALSDCEVGADIQHPVTLRNNLVRRICTEREISLIEGSADPALTLRGVWCMKEAYLKMLGIGIAADMKTADTSMEKFPAGYVHFDSYTVAACEERGVTCKEVGESVVRVDLGQLIVNS